MSTALPATQARTLTMAQAIAEATAQEMERDPRVFVMGEDVGKYGGIFSATAGLFERFGLSGRIDEPVRAFSHGMRKKLSFLAAVLHHPAALLCDEALEGFDTAAGLAARDELRTLAGRGTAVLFSSHVTETVERLCDRVVLLHLGRVHRSLARSDWGGSTPALSALEREFLAVTSSTPS